MNEQAHGPADAQTGEQAHGGVRAPQVDPDVFVADDADIIGDVTIAKGCSIWYHVTIRADRAPVRIGEGSSIQDNAVIHEDYGQDVIIGNYVTVGHNAIVHGAKVGDGSLIGMGAVLMNGSRVGKDCVIGAGALVTQDMEIPDNSVAMGVPAKITGSVTPELAAKFRRNAEDYVREAAVYRTDPPARYEKP